MKNIRTVGDLRRMIAQLDAKGVSDDMPIARRGNPGWINGFDEASEIELVKLGEGQDTFTISEAEFKALRKWKGPQSKFTALSFD